jgi:guanylate kinase
MNNQEHVLLCVMAKTAAGKDSLVNRLCQRNGIKNIISYTTRERRTNEGDTHIFVTEEDYERMKTEGKIAAFTQIGQYKYWSTVDQLYENQVYIIDPVGVKSLKELNLPNLRLVTVYINVPDEERTRRALESRGDDRLKFKERDFAERAQFKELLKNADFDYSIPNQDIAKSYSVLKWIAIAEGVFDNKNIEVTQQND